MAAATCALYSLSLPPSSYRPTPRPTSLPLAALRPRPRPLASVSLSFSAAVSSPLGGLGSPAMAVAGRRRQSVVCEAAPAVRSVDQSKKRQRQNERLRLHHKAYKSEMRTRMKRVLVALEKLRKKKDAQAEEIIPIEKLIAEAYKAIDKTVTAGAIHRNTGARRKSKLARTKTRIEIRRGWYVPAARPTIAA